MLSLWTKITLKAKTVILFLVATLFSGLFFFSRKKRKEKIYFNFDALKRIEEERENKVKIMIKGDIDESNKKEIISELNRNSFNN